MNSDRPEISAWQRNHPEAEKGVSADAVQGQEGSQGQGPVDATTDEHADGGSRIVTMNEARAAVCASVIRVVNECVDEYAGMIAAGEGVLSETQRENDRRTMTAFTELGQVLGVMCRKFRKADRPLIMQPSRSVKVVR